MPTEDRPGITRISNIRSSTIIARVTGRKSVRSALGWGVVFGLYVASQAVTYAGSYGTPVERHLLSKDFGSNPGISALVGPASRIDTVPGFTAWKCLMVLAITAAVWGILSSTKFLRGEEDAGRWEMLLVGRTTPRAAAVQALTGMLAGLVTLLIVSGLIIVVAGRPANVAISVSGGSFLAVGIVAGAAMFMAVGALASQLSSTRRQAAGYASAVLGASYAIRMVADAGTGLDWLRWASPLGWIEELAPLTKPDALPLIPIALLTVAASAMAVYLAGHRDLGASVLPDHASAPARLRLLSGHVGLALRLTRPTLLAWTGAIVAYGLLLGSIAKSGGKLITSSPSMELLLARLGVTGAEAYLGFSLLIMAMALNFVAAGQISAIRMEESSGRLEYLLVRPLSRTSWLAWRIALSALVLVLGGLVSGLSTWIGAASQHAGVPFTSMITASFNVVPPAMLLLGVGVLAYGLVPRAAAWITYAVLVWWLLVEITGGIVQVNHWLLDTSAFHQMAAAPSVPVDWTTNGVMVGIGLVSAFVGVLAFSRRDMKGE